eukprot:5131130-Prymnesium_polylepis.1
MMRLQQEDEMCEQQRTITHAPPRAATARAHLPRCAARVRVHLPRCAHRHAACCALHSYKRLSNFTK